MSEHCADSQIKENGTKNGTKEKLTNKGKTEKKKWRRGHFFSAFMEKIWTPARAPFHLSAAAFTK